MNSFQFPASLILENERVLLRSIEMADVNQLAHFAVQEPDLWKYSLVPANADGGLETYIQQTLEAKKAGTEYPFIVFDKLKNAYAGSTRFYDIQVKNQMLQLGYTWYGKDFQGTGLNAHCKYLLLEYAFEKVGMQRVEFRADNGNAKSIAAMKGIGCTIEGVIRSHAPKYDGTRRDSIILSILKNEWQERVKELLKAKIGKP
jgi:N-acetyltransferase